MRRRTVWKLTIGICLALLVAAAAAIIFRTVRRVKSGDVTGVVLVDNPDPKEERPLANVRLEAETGTVTVTDATGLFRFKLPATSLLSGLEVTLERPDYAPLHSVLAANGELYVLRMKFEGTDTTSATEIPVSDVRVRYTESARTSVDTGSALKRFGVVNTGNVPCNGQSPCSPDGKWKAAIGGATLDAGEGSEFREARISCIAGPCPFTRIENDGFSNGGRNISVLVRNWSDTVSFVLEAEVTRTTMTDMIRTSYPLIFGRGMNFSLPPSGEGPSIEAMVGGFEAVYPLGPGLTTSWATCSAQTAKEGTANYRCDLKPGFRFQ
ncbi:MAG TPA: hypothetical protein VG273_25520 [Bryobacteraceae bacterium]|jgi:hypothetical protein|nr:hypothetical protein [Bryobacteraceae bacterium]